MYSMTSNSSADFLNPLCRVLPIRQDITYDFALLGRKRKYIKSKTTAELNREKNIDRRGPRQIGTV